VQGVYRIDKKSPFSDFFHRLVCRGVGRGAPTTSQRGKPEVQHQGGGANKGKNLKPLVPGSPNSVPQKTIRKRGAGEEFRGDRRGAGAKMACGGHEEC